MQTFVTDSDPKKCAENLDNKRLGKQRLECLQILRALEDEKYGWRNHPIVKMWSGYSSGLQYYTNCMIEEWKKRGFKNTMLLFEEKEYILPWWFTWSQLHFSHRASLLRKNASFYENIFTVEDSHKDQGYIWTNHLSPFHLDLAKQNIWIEPKDICFPKPEV